MELNYILKVGLTGFADYGWDMWDQGNLGLMVDSQVSGFGKWINGWFQLLIWVRLRTVRL